MATPEASIGCPTCGAHVPVLEPYLTWCHECGWNLKAPDAAAPTTRLDALSARVGVRLDTRLLERLARTDELSPHLTPSRAAAYVIAACVYGVSLALLVVIGLTAFYAVSHPWAFVLVLFLLGVAYVLHPRPGKLRTVGLVERAAAPALYTLCDEIAAALGTKPIQALVIDHRFNAEWAVLGWRRRRTLTLGLPLVAMLPPQAQVALIAHELAHARNGDSTRGFFVGGALNALAEWHQMLGPQEEGVTRTGLEPVVNLLMWVVSRPIAWLLLLELHLVLRDCQRAEYVADLLAAEVAGADAVVELHERLLLETTFLGVVRQAAHDSPDELLARARSVVDAVPERERERRRRVARLESARLRSSHPPTGSRIRLVERRGSTSARVVLGEGRAASIEAELRSRHAPVEKALVDRYRASLYY